MMFKNRWDRGVIAFAWVLSLSIHIILMIILYGGFQRFESSRETAQESIVDTVVKAPMEVTLSEMMPLKMIAKPQETKVVSIPDQPSLIKEPISTSPNPVPMPKPPIPGPLPNLTNPLTGTSSSGQPNSTDAQSNGSSTLSKGAALHPSLKAGKSIVYVLDRSASMGQKQKLTQAKAILAASIDQLNWEVQFQVVLYHNQAEKLLIHKNDDLMPATELNRNAVKRALALLAAEGSSNHIEGLRVALLLKPDVIFLLTDAEDLTDGQWLTIAKHNRQGTVIYPVLLGGENKLEKPSGFIRLAETSKGRVIPR